MTKREDENLYVERYATDSEVSGDGTTSSGTDLLNLDVAQQAQLTSLEITTETVGLFEVVVRNQDGTDSKTVKSYATSDLVVGDFEDPVYSMVGAGREVVLINRTELPDENSAFNMKLHEIEAES